MESETQQIRIERIDPPAYAMRAAMDEQKLQELCASIKKHGLLQPLVVRQVGKRYEIIAGHRRYTAAGLIGLPTLPCTIKVADDKAADTMRVHENYFREDVNVIDEAEYIVKLIDLHKMEPDELSKLTGKSEEYLKGRYELMHYPDYLVDALRHESISIGAAKWIVRIEDDNVRREYTRFACTQGIAVSEAMRWYESWKMGNLPRDAASYVPPAVQEGADEKPVMLPCVICREADILTNLQMHYAHGACVHSASKAVADYLQQQELAHREAPAG